MTPFSFFLPPPNARRHGLAQNDPTRLGLLFLARVVDPHTRSFPIGNFPFVLPHQRGRYTLHYTHTHKEISLSFFLSIPALGHHHGRLFVRIPFVARPTTTHQHSHKHHAWFFVYSLISHVIIRQLIIEYSAYFGRRAQISFAWWYYPTGYLISPTHPSTLSRAAAVRIAFLCVTLLPAHAETQSSTPHSFHPFLLCTDYNTTTTTTTASTLLYTTSTDLKQNVPVRLSSLHHSLPYPRMGQATVFFSYAFFLFLSEEEDEAGRQNPGLSHSALHLHLKDENNLIIKECDG